MGHVNSSESARVADVLRDERSAIVGAAAQSIRHVRSYEAEGADETRERLEAIHGLVVAAVSDLDLDAIVARARGLADERFRSGYDLTEVQTALNALEETMWRTLCARLQPDELALALGLISTVLGAAKDALAREYVSLASQTHAQSLDLRALFAGAA